MRNKTTKFYFSDAHVFRCKFPAAFLNNLNGLNIVRLKLSPHSDFIHFLLWLLAKNMLLESRHLNLYGNDL